MNLRPDSAMYVALMIVAGKMARQVEAPAVVFNASRACDELGVSRTYPYVLASRIEECLAPLFGRQPGRPILPAVVPSGGERADLALTITLLRFQLEHPGAVVQHNGRRSYSPAFRRLVLQQHDLLVPVQMGEALFGSAAEVPIDTLNDWLRSDRAGLEEQVVQLADRHRDLRPPAEMSEGVRVLFAELQRWEGSTRDFIAHGTAASGLTRAQVRRVLQIMGVITPRHLKPPRHRGSAEQMAPGAVGVQDAKIIDIKLMGSGRNDRRTVHMQADQATQTITGHVVVDDECAAGGAAAFEKSVHALGGTPPLALLVDNKPCYKEERFRSGIEKTTMIIHSTKGRPQNNAVAEGGVFSVFEHAVGTITLDDSSTEALVSSAVSEVFRAYGAARNTTPCAEFGGQSRQTVLQSYRPSFERQQRDLEFLRKLKARHERKYPTFEDERSRALLDEGFARWHLLEKDPTGSLRRYLSYCSPAAVKLGLAVFAAKMGRGVLDERHNHRYLAKLIRTFQEEEDLRAAEDELLKLCNVDLRWWTNHEEEAYRNLLAAMPDHAQRASQIAERAAFQSLPIAAAFWRAKLKAEVALHPEIASHVRRHVTRLYEGDFNVRLDLLAGISDAEMAA